MPVYTVEFYEINPSGLIPTGTGNSFVWTGPASYGGTAVITDNEAGIGGLTLDDDSAGSEAATATVTTGSGTSTNVTVDAELVWTVQDTVTGETFEVAQFQVEGGGASGFYTLSETPLVAGRSYTVLDYDSNPNASGGDIAITYADFGDGIVDGTATGDLIDPDYLDPDGDAVDDNTVQPGDVIEAGAGDDTVIGGQGSDTINGDLGDDLVYGDYGDYTPDAIAETLDWTDQGGNGTNLGAGFTQDTGSVDVTVGFVSDGNNVPTFEVDSASTQYTGGDYDPNSSLFLFGNGDGATSTTTIDFAPSSEGTAANEVENVSFRINDVDWGSGNHTDIVTVNAYDADGNLVPVTFTLGGGDTETGNTITAEQVAESPNSLGGSVLVEIAGPVASIEVTYSNGQGGTQGIWITDVDFDAVPIAEGDDSILGGAGNDTLFGQAGDDTLDGGDDADSLNGGIGDDSLLGGTGDDTLEGGAGADTLSGGAGQDYASYAGSDAGVTVDLTTNSFSGGHATGDVNGGGLDGIIGSDFDDNLTGYDGQGADWTNVFYGGDGNDTMDGRGGDDSLFGEQGADSILGGAGDDYIDGGSQNDSLSGGTGADTILGGTGADTLDGGDDDDSLSGGGGSDSLIGGAGNDTLDGGNGADVLIGGLGADSIIGGAGDDTIFASAGDTVVAGDGDDLITLTDTGEGPGTIFVEGNTAGQSGGDTLDLNGLADRTTINITDNTGGELTGTVQLLDGTLVSFSNIDSVICFTPGTHILTDTGPRPIETLVPGDLVATRDNGFQALRWIGSRRVLATGDNAPVRIAPQLFGGHRALTVSPQHRMLIQGAQAELLFGASEVFAAAAHLIDDQTVTQISGGEVTYIHLLFDSHQVIYAEGMATESFFAGETGLQTLHPAAREQLFDVMPHLRSGPDAYGDTARICLRSFEAQMLRDHLAGRIALVA